MVDWRKLTAMATRTADRVFGEPVRLFFLVGGKADPERAPLDIHAQLHLPGESDVQVAKGNKVFSTSVVAGTGLVIISKAQFNGQLRQGDRVRAESRDGQPIFEVTAVDGAGHDQLVATISTPGKRS